MIEVEIKLPVQEDLTGKLMSMGFTAGETIEEKDTYFDNEENSIREQGQALRVREVRCHADTAEENGILKECMITFKGKRLDTISMTRQELETRVEDPEVCRLLFQALGYKPAGPQVFKIRRHYHLHMDNKDGRRTINACLDRVEGLGDFMELEIVMPDQENRDEALATLMVVLKELGYSMEDTVRNSYLSMLMGTMDK